MHHLARLADAGLTPRIDEAGSVAHQSVGFDDWNCITRRQMDNLDPPAAKESVDPDVESFEQISRHTFEGFIDLLTGACIEDLNLQSNGARCGFYVF